MVYFAERNGMRSNRQRLVSAIFCVAAFTIGLVTYLYDLTTWPHRPAGLFRLLTQSQPAMPDAPGLSVIGQDGVVLDISNRNEGYIGIQCLSTNDGLKVQITAPNELVYTYDINSGGQLEFFPLSEGSGTYQVSVYGRIEGILYYLMYSAPVEVALVSQTALYTYPNQQVYYTVDSQIVALADKLTKDCLTDDEKTRILYYFVALTLEYDYDAAQRIKSGSFESRYRSDPDDTWQRKTGVCYDFAVLYAAMLRAEGIPARLVKGFVLKPGATAYVYHAWNEVWDGAAWQIYDATLCDLEDNCYYIPISYY